MSYKYSDKYNFTNFKIKKGYTERYQLRHSTGYERRKTQHKPPKPNRFTLFVGLLLLIVVIIVAICLITKANQTSNDSTPQSPVETVATEPQPTQITYTFTNDTTDIPKDNNAEYAIVIDKSDNTVVAARKAHKRTYPASTTKIMTLLVAVENIKDMNSTFTMTLDITDPLYIAEASVAGFKEGEVISMTDLLYGTILPSGADAATALAISVAGSEENFVELMNKKVAELGLENTHFSNVTGLHSEDNYSSAYDMAVILDAALQNELCKEVLSTYQHTTASTEQNPDGLLLSSTLFNYMYGTEPETATILGGKTGYVYEAGYCIASYGEANDTGNQYIVVTMKNSSIWPAMHGQIDIYKKFAK